jgi:hypothetical protein
MQEIERILRQATGALDGHFKGRITACGKSERLREARVCIGHDDLGTSVVDRAAL